MLKVTINQPTHALGLITHKYTILVGPEALMVRVDAILLKDRSLPVVTIIILEGSQESTRQANSRDRVSP